MKDTRLGLGGRRYLHIRGSAEFGFQVWLNSLNDYDGVLLARHDEQDRAVEAAVTFLKQATDRLSKLAPGGVSNDG